MIKTEQLKELIKSEIIKTYKKQGLGSVKVESKPDGSFVVTIDRYITTVSIKGTIKI